jgi:hypothetical protein
MLTADESDPTLEYAAVAASVAILAGIAAADAACCQALGRRSRSDNHHDAEILLAETPPVASGRPPSFANSSTSRTPPITASSA